MNEPRYTYKAEAPCFSITHDQPFELRGCSCGWPKSVCLKRQGRNLGEREREYKATIYQRAGDEERQ